jgi:myosin heavy subunit
MMKLIQSNNDPTPQDLLECACNTSNEFLRKELEKLLKSKESSRDGGSTRNSMPSRRTVLVKFRSQLNELMKYIEETSVRYIRCIKPNSDMKPKITNHRQTINQLESAGLITAITISRETFPNHLKYDIIWERFLCLYDYDDILGSGRLFSISHSFSFNDKQLKENVTKMLSSLLTIPFIRSDGARVPSFSCGKTKVYFRTGALEHLEGERMEFYSLRAEIIQSWFRCQEARIQFKQTRSLIILTQAKVRRYISRKEFLTVKLSATSFQALFKGFVARQTYGKERSACIVIQSWSRCQNLRLKYNRSKKLVIYTQARIRRFIARRSYLLIILIVKLQSYLKCFTNQRIFQKYRYSAILIQSTVRGIKARQYYVELRRGAIKIQSKWRSYYLKEKYTRIIKATIMLQSYYKARVAVNSYAQARSSCLLIQCHFRMFLANSSLVRFKEMKDSFDQTQAILIQSWYRGIKTRLAYAQQLHSIVVIQSFARMVVPRMNYLLEKELMDDEDDFSQSR